MRLAYLGPPGTFTEEAALHYAPDAERIPYPTITAVAQAVRRGNVDQGVVPIENSLEGSVAETLDLLLEAESPLRIYQEMVLPIQHYLLVKPGTRREDIRTIFSHPQALGQCRHYIERTFPSSVGIVPTTSTAAAVAEMMSFPLPAAAIGTLRAAELYGAVPLDQGIQDHPGNETRFVVLALTDHEPTGRDRISLSFTFAEDRPGLLVSVLQEFSQRGINLSKVESRPMKTALGNYFFLVDLEGHQRDPVVAEALEQVAKKVASLRVFGSYPRR